MKRPSKLSSESFKPSDESSAASYGRGGAECKRSRKPPPETRGARRPRPSRPSIKSNGGGGPPAFEFQGANLCLYSKEVMKASTICARLTRLSATDSSRTSSPGWLNESSFPSQKS